MTESTADVTGRKPLEEALNESEARYRELFEQTPIGIWEADYSGAKEITDRLQRRGVRDFRRYFRRRRDVFRQVVAGTRALNANQAARKIYRAPHGGAGFLRAMADAKREGVWDGYFEEALAALAEGASHVVVERPEKAFDGAEIVTRNVVHIADGCKDTWSRVVTTEEDITEQKQAEDGLKEREARYRELFEQAPIGIWEEDYSAVKRMIDELRDQGVRDFRRHFREHPETLRKSVAAIKSLDVNRAGLDIYRAANMDEYRRFDADPTRWEQEEWEFYIEELAAMAEGQSRFVAEFSATALDGSTFMVRNIT